MDGVLFWILLLVFYFVLQGLAGRQTEETPEQTRERRKKTQGRSGASHPQTTQSTQPSQELDDALGEIRDLLGGTGTTQTQSPRPSQEKPRRQRTTQQRTPRERTTRQRPERTGRTERTRTRETSRPRRQRSTTSLDQASDANEMATRQAQMQEMADKMQQPSKVKSHLDIEHLDIPSHEEMIRKRRNVAADNMRVLLRNDESARQAVLISEILGAPRSRYSNLKRLTLLKR